MPERKGKTTHSGEKVKKSGCKNPLPSQNCEDYNKSVQVERKEDSDMAVQQISSSLTLLEGSNVPAQKIFRKELRPTVIIKPREWSTYDTLQIIQREQSENLVDIMLDHYTVDINLKTLAKKVKDWDLPDLSPIETKILQEGILPAFAAEYLETLTDAELDWVMRVFDVYWRDQEFDLDAFELTELRTLYLKWKSMALGAFQQYVQDHSIADPQVQVKIAAANSLYGVDMLNSSESKQDVDLAVKQINQNVSLSLVDQVSIEDSINFLPAPVPKEDATEEEWTLRTPKAVYDLAERALRSQAPTERLAFMRQYVMKYPGEAEKQADYIKLLERLVAEQNGDYSDPVTPYGCLIHFRQLSEDEFIEKLKPMSLHFDNGYMPEEERRTAYRRMMEVEVPELPEEERSILYTLGSTLTPTQRKFFIEDLKGPADEVLFEYCSERGNYDAFEASDWIAEEALDSLFRLQPDVQLAVLKTIMQPLPTISDSQHS